MIISLLGNLSIEASIMGNFIISVCTILGDLLESSIKRFFSIKDTSALLPGHGGFLDRIDGLLLSIPVLFIAILWIL